MLNLIGSLASAAAGEKTLDAGEVIIHHVVDGPLWIPDAWWSPSKAVLWMTMAATIVVIGVLRAVRGYDEDGVPRTRWAQMLDPFVVHFYRDVAVPNVGAKWAPKVAPLLMCFFFFILTCNLLGLVPLADLLGVGLYYGLGPERIHESALFIKVVEGASTPTGNFNVTMALAAITFVSIIIFGSLKHGFVGHFAHLAPKDAPFIVRWLLLVPIETLSMFVKPFALTMRLAANMSAGHMGLLALLLLPALLVKGGFAGSISTAAGGVAALLAVGIMLLEIIVCFVQAYVFALLSGVFIGLAIHSH